MSTADDFRRRNRQGQNRSLTPPWVARRRRREKQAAREGKPVGTEAAAVANLERNARLFAYPKDGFVCKIEYSLLYAMISEPKVFPEDVVLEELEKEDFEQYMEVGTKTTFSNGEDDGDEDPIMSYAQLSAMLALSAEKNSHSSMAANDQHRNQSTSSSTSAPGAMPDGTEVNAVAQKLCKTILNTVIRYAREHDLDRAAEIRELMDPVERYCSNRIETAELKSILPLYVGYTASILTGNPLPLLVGTGLTVAGAEGTNEQRNTLSSIQNETKRKGDVEKASLLDEVE